MVSHCVILDLPSKSLQCVCMNSPVFQEEEFSSLESDSLRRAAQMFLLIS